MTFDQLVILVFGPLGVLLAMAKHKRHQRWAPIVGLMGQAAWFYTLWVHAQWGAFVAAFFYLFAWLVGLWNHWGREIKEKWQSVRSSQKWIGRSIEWFRHEVSMIRNSL